MRFAGHGSRRSTIAYGRQFCEQLPSSGALRRGTLCGCLVLVAGLITMTYDSVRFGYSVIEGEGCGKEVEAGPDAFQNDDSS